MKSLRARIALAAGVVLAAFILLTSVALEQAFRESARSAREERLLGQLYLLMAAADSDTSAGLTLPQELAESRFSLPGSGLYGQISDVAGRAVWRSPSAVNVEVPFESGLRAGDRRFELRRNGDGRSFLVESFGVSWAIGDAPRLYTFSVAEDLAEFDAQVAHFRVSLAGWLGAMSLMMLVALWLAMRWGLGPLRKVAQEVAEVEAGRQERIAGEYPNELRALTDNLNALLTQERARQARLANAMGDLAHSLKTPLAVVRGALAEERLEPGVRRAIEEQVARMDGVVAHHLQRAATVGPSRLAPPVPVRPVAEKLVAALSKVYRDKAVEAAVDVAEGIAFRGVEGDLMELLGNLLDNAYKWCAARVRVSAARGEAGLELRVEDDGPGIPPSEAQWLIERGVRADESVPGHGIGLATVRDVAQAYSGTVTIERSPLGGARVAISLRD
jgi:two-component system, OmpR family, sensor histidine kinase PhoQ